MLVTATAATRLDYERAVHFLMASGLPEFCLISSPAMQNTFERSACSVSSLASIQTQGLTYSRCGFVQHVNRCLFLTPSEQQMAIVRCALIADRIPGLKNRQLSLYRRCMCLHAYMRRQYTYRMESPADHSVKTLLQEGQGCCQAISALVYLILNAAGIPCCCIVGELAGENSAKHSWNAVRDKDGNWYHIDYSACSGMLPANSFNAIGRAQLRRHEFDPGMYAPDALDLLHTEHEKRTSAKMHISLQNTQGIAIEYMDGKYVHLHAAEPLLCRHQNEWFIALPFILDLLNGGIVRTRDSGKLVVRLWNTTYVLDDALTLNEHMISVSVLKKFHLSCRVQDNWLTLCPDESTLFRTQGEVNEG